MNREKIVIIASAIFPHNSPRSFRATELALGFAKRGFNVTLYAILGHFDYTSFERENRIKVRDLGKSYFGNIDSDGRSRKKLINRALGRIFHDAIDYPRIEFFLKTIKALKKEDKIDYLITIAHPFAIHWGVAFYKKYIDNSLFRVWSSDCGDPFMGDPDEYHWKLTLKPVEKFWCKQTDFICIPVKQGKIGYYSEFHKKIHVIPQGVDFSKVTLNEYKENTVPTFLYSGVVYPGMRDPTLFLEYLCSLKIDFKFIIYTFHNSVFERYKIKLGEKLEIRQYIPRLELIRVLSTMDFLINFKNNSEVQQPSKLIDYALSRRPIIDISTVFGIQEKGTFEEFLEKNYANQRFIDNLFQYDISNVCEKFLELYKKKCKTK